MQVGCRGILENYCPLTVADLLSAAPHSFNNNNVAISKKQNPVMSNSNILLNSEPVFIHAQGLEIFLFTTASRYWLWGSSWG
jgi:hypothetical protein